jgi:hypothetical protein
MNIAETYSHLNGLEYLLVHQPALWDEIQGVIAGVDATKYRAGISEDKTLPAKSLCSPLDMNACFRAELEKRGGWHGYQHQAKTVEPAGEHGECVATTCFAPVCAPDPADLVRERVAVGARIGDRASVAWDLFARHMAFYHGDRIDVGIVILPMKSLQSVMGDGVAYYEAELRSIQGRGCGTPRVPLVLIGIEA